MESARYAVRPFRDGDAGPAIDLWNEVFAREPGATPRSRAEWEWLYAAQPSSRQVMVAVEPNGRLIAQYSGLPLRFQVGDRVMVAALVLDSMVHPDYRLGLHQDGAFLRTAREWFSVWSSPDRNAVHYGFPNRSAYPIGRRFLAYEPFVEPIPVLYRNFFEDPEVDAVGREVLSTTATELEVEEVARFGEHRDRLDEWWYAQAPRHPFAIVRDADWLAWRFDACPWLPHRRFLLRARDGRIRGWFATRSRWQGQPILAISDLLVDPDDAVAMATLLRHATRLARETAHGRVELWLPDTHPTFRHALAAGFRTQPGCCVMVLQLRADAMTRAAARAACYYTIADSDIW